MGSIKAFFQTLLIMVWVFAAITFTAVGIIGFILVGLVARTLIVFIIGVVLLVGFIQRV